VSAGEEFISYGIDFKNNLIKKIKEFNFEKKNQSYSNQVFFTNFKDSNL
jgi:hypothetical protein